MLASHLLDGLQLDERGSSATKRAVCRHVDALAFTELKQFRLWQEWVVLDLDKVTIYVSKAL